MHSKAHVLKIFSLTSSGIKLIQDRLKDRHVKKKVTILPSIADPFENHSIHTSVIKKQETLGLHLPIFAAV